MREGGGSFFGRRKGKTLKPTQRGAMGRALPALLLDPSVTAPANLAGLFEAPVERVRLEIGFGGGEHLLHEAAAYPEIGFIGVEPFENGLAKAVTAIEQDCVRNVRLFNDDAALLLDWLPTESIARVDLLYPDPWPKLRHWKRRFVRDENLDRVARVLAADGEFRFASDVEVYVKWTLREVARNGRLVPRTARMEECREPWAGWPGTRYEAKAIADGRRPTYLTFRRAIEL